MISAELSVSTGRLEISRITPFATTTSNRSRKTSRSPSNTRADRNTVLLVMLPQVEDLDPSILIVKQCDGNGDFFIEQRGQNLLPVRRGLECPYALLANRFGSRGAYQVEVLAFFSMHRCMMEAAKRNKPRNQSRGLSA